MCPGSYFINFPDLHTRAPVSVQLFPRKYPLNPANFETLLQFVGFYLMFVMTSTAFWLFLTVGILNMHYKDPQEQPPRWVEAVAVNVMAKFLCMNVTTIKHKHGYMDNSILQESTGRENTNIETDRISWIKITKIFDRFFLIIFGVMSLASMIIFLCFYPTKCANINPKEFPKEQILWNLTDF